MEGREVVEAKADAARADVGGNGRVELFVVDGQAQALEREAELGDGYFAIAVAVEEIEDAAEADGVQARRM